MDFHGLKRKELQALCKKHGVPANLTNREMVDRLASIFKENEEAVSLEKLSTNPEGIGSENEAKVVKKQAKKVRFSPENQTIEYEVSVYRRPGKRSRKQMLCKNPAQVIENASNREDIRKVEDCQVRVTRSRVQNVVEDDVNRVFSPPVGRKRGRGGMKNKEAEVTNIGKSEVLEMGQREDVKNAHEKVTGGFSGRQLRSRKNVTQEDSKKIRKSKGGDEVPLLDGSSEEGYVREDAKSKNGSKQSTRNARKEDQSVVKSEVKIVGVQRGCEEVLQLKEPQKGRGKNALRQNAVPQRMSAENSLLAGGAEAEMPFRRPNCNAEKDCAKSAPSVKSENQVTMVQEQSERDIALEEPPECLRRYSSRRKSVVPQSGKGGNKEAFLKKETRKRSRTAELDAILEHSVEIERAKYAFTSQDQAPLRRSTRKIVILNAPALTDAESANKEDIGKMQQLRAPFLGKGMREELPRKSSPNSSRYSLSGTFKEDQIAVAKNDQELKQQMQEPILEEEKTSVLEHHPVTEKPQRRSNRITSISASVAPHNPTAKGVEKKQQSKSRMAIIEEEAALTESLPAPGELPAGKDELVVAEGAGNKHDLDLNVSKQAELVVAEGAGNKNDLDLNVRKQAVKNAEACSNKRRKGLRGNSGAKKQCGFAEASPLFLEIEERKDSAGNMEETLIATSVKLVGPSIDQKTKQTAHKSMVVYEKKSNLVGDDIEKLVHGGNVESVVNCMSSQSVNTTCVLDDANCSDPKRQKFESNVSHVVDSSEITFPAESQGHGMSNQEMKEDIKPIETHSAHESLVVYKEERSLVEGDKERLLQLDTADSESNGSKMVCPEITSLADAFSSANKADLAGKTSSGVELEKVFEAEEPSENINSVNYNKDTEGSRTPVAEHQIKGQLKDANLTVADSIEEGIFNDLLNERGASIGLKRGSEIPLKKSEKLSTTQFSDGEGIALTESFMEATDKQEHRAEMGVVAAITGTPNSTEMKCSSSGDTAPLETPFGPAPQSKDKLCSAGITVCIAGSEICSQDVETSLVEDDKEILVQDDTIEGEIKNQPCLSLNKTGALDDALVEFESNANKVVCSEMTSLAVVCSSANQTNLAGEPSNELIPEKVLDLGESSRGENVNYKRDKIEVEDDKSPAKEDQSSMHVEDANKTAAGPVQEVVSWDHLKKFCESCGTKEFEVSLKKSEETSTDDSSGKGMVQTESSLKINEMGEATAKIHTVTAETGEKTFMATQWSWSDYDKPLFSPLRSEVGSQDLQGIIYGVETAVSKAGYGMSRQQKNEENVKIVENEHQETINSEKELFFSGKKILDESSEGKFWADGVFGPLSDGTDSQCAKDKKVDISDGSFNNVSGETQERPICEVLDGEGTDPVSSEEKGNDYQLEAGDSREVGSCSKLDGVSSVKPETVINCSFLSSICATSDEHKDLENPDESHILTNMVRSLFFGDEDEDKKPDAKDGDRNGAALDKNITGCKSIDIKEEDYVARSDVDDTNFSVKKDGPEDIEETMELRKDVSGLFAAMADKSPLLKNSEVGRVVDHEEAFRSELNLLSPQKRKTVTAKKERSNSVSVKQLTSSTMKSKSKSSLIRTTPKQLTIHYMKENEGSTKREQIGNRTTPKTSSKRRPLTHVWK